MQSKIEKKYQHGLGILAAYFESAQYPFLEFFLLPLNNFVFKVKALNQSSKPRVYQIMKHDNKTSDVLIGKFLFIDIRTLLGVLLVKFIYKTHNYLDYAF